MKSLQTVLITVTLASLVAFPGLSLSETPAEISPDDAHFFETSVRPLLIDHCYDCHSVESGESEGDLLLDSAKAIRLGGSLGPAIIPGKPEQSRLFKAVRFDNASLQMPPDGKLKPEEIETLAEWIRRGAPDPRVGDTPASPEQTPKPSPLDINPQSHWAFNPPKRLANEYSRHPHDVDIIDAHARQAARDAKLPIADRASDATLVRRLYFDLTGLPPMRQQVDAYVASTRRDKTEQLVDQLLASSEYAERFARHWMDVARYADTIGYSTAGKDRRIHGSERYRDWLIRSFASDLPYDQMIRMQLAADRFDTDNAEGHLDAMGFLTIGRKFLNLYDTLDDRIDVITRGLLGLTVTCARCHDHKFDPIPTSDYYALLGVLQSSHQPKDGASPLMMKDKGKPVDSRIFLRGQPGAKGEIAPRRYLTALRDKKDPPFQDGSGRKELAEKIASASNPLVARVFVNRLWGHLMGRPLVDSTSDFGIRTEPPKLVGVLDDLSAEFATHWSIKRLVRRIVTSRLYAQSSSVDMETLEIDPENRLFARVNRKRRGFESMRDAMLLVSGQLVRTIGGESVEVHLNSPSRRRTVYAKIDRQNLPSLFRTFDFASPDAHAPTRYETTVPQQALFLMNHPQSGTLSEAIANRVEQDAPVTDNQRKVTRLFERVLGREPSSSELEKCSEFLSLELGEPEARFDSRLAWKYGTAPINEDNHAREFQPFAHFNGSTWQHEATFPSPSEFAYASLGLENGHPGRDRAVVRRWIAPANGIVEVNGMVGHRNKEGDGINLALWMGEKRVWRANHKSNNFPFKDLKGYVEKGQVVDFVVSPNKSDSFDSFFLRCQISLIDENGKTWGGDSKRDFSGPIDPQSSQNLDRMAQLAQVLMQSNEFLFVD